MEALAPALPLVMKQEPMLVLLAAVAVAEAIRMAPGWWCPPR